MKGILTGPHAGWIESSALGAKMNDAEMLLVPMSPGCNCDHIGMVGEVEITNVFEANTVSFGEYPCGRYTVRYCGGSWNFRYGIPPGSNWVAGRAPTGFETPPGGEGYFIKIYYSDGASQTVVPEDVPGASGYTNEVAVETAICGASVTFDHLGGEIYATFEEYYYPDNTLAANGPTYRLYGVTSEPQLEFTSVTAVVSPGPDFSARFNFTESTSWSGPIVFTMAESGGITSQDGPHTVDVTADTPFYVDFRWNASTTVVTATITASDICGNVIETFEIDVAPIITATLSSVTDVGTWCSPSRHIYGVYFTVNNEGNQQTENPTVITVTAASGCILCSNADYCNDVSSPVTNAGGILAGAHQDMGQYVRKDGSGSPTCTLNVSVYDGYVTHPTVQVTATFP